eukprot:m.543085 g.543085  ORF g.543085 m.543085 type:complete len:71 (-) comp57667_c0_seq1:1725-1937(-)
MLGHLLKLQASSHTIDTNTDDGEYPLVAAIAGGSIECLQLLVAAGTQMSTCLLGVRKCVCLLSDRDPSVH